MRPAFRGGNLGLGNAGLRLQMVDEPVQMFDRCVETLEFIRCQASEGLPYDVVVERHGQSQRGPAGVCYLHQFGPAIVRSRRSEHETILLERVDRLSNSAGRLIEKARNVGGAARLFREIREQF